MRKVWAIPEPLHKDASPKRSEPKEEKRKKKGSKAKCLKIQSV